MSGQLVQKKSTGTTDFELVANGASGTFLSQNLDGTHSFTEIPISAVTSLQSEIDDKDQRLGNTQGTGLVSGGVISTVFGSTTYDISAGSGYIVDNWTDPENPVTTIVSWTAKSGLTPAGLLTLNTQFVGIDINGDVIEFGYLPSEIEMRDFIYLGKLLIDEDTQTTVVGLTFPRMKYGFASQFDDLIASIGIINRSGNKITANGANLSLDRSEGVTYRTGASYTSGYKNPSTITNAIDTAFTFSGNYRSASPGVFLSDGLHTELTPNLWDDGSGTLQTVPDGHFTNQRVYFFTNGNTFITYGQKLYETINEALIGVKEESVDVEDQFLTDASLRAIISLRSDATDLTQQREARISSASKLGEVEYPGGSKTLDFKSATFISGAVGTYYTHGFYKAPSTDVSLTQASATQSYGSSNQPYGAHAFIVAGGAGLAAGGSGAVQIKVSGTSITDLGVRTASDSEIIVPDITALSTNDYAESDKKWLGQVTFTIENASGSTQTTFSADVNYGLAKYEDWGNRQITITDFEVSGNASANDTGFDIELLKHTQSGWTYNASSFIPGDGSICRLTTDYGAESDLTNGEDFAYKRADLETFIDGMASEGVLVRFTTGSNNSIRAAAVHIGAEFI